MIKNNEIVVLSKSHLHFFIIKKIFVYFSAFFFFLLMSGNVCGQNTIATSGGDITGTAGSASFTVGQVACYYFNFDGGAILQGVQQPIEIFEVEINQYNSDFFNIEVYPNPAVENITLIISKHEIKNFSYKLYDENSRVIFNSNIAENKTIINLNNLNPNVYILEILDGMNRVRTFKIIKNSTL